MGFFTKDKDKGRRSLTEPGELLAGDILVLKERRSLPRDLQGQQLEVTEVGTYQYSGSIEKELTLRSVDNTTYYLTLGDTKSATELSFSVKIPRKTVCSVFDEDAFAELWEPGSSTLHVVNRLDDIAAWLSDEYQQEVNTGEGYYYARDCTDNPPSDYQDDDGEEFRFHECTSLVDDNFSLSVEVWADGDTEVFLEVRTPGDVIAEMWPHGD